MISGLGGAAVKMGCDIWGLADDLPALLVTGEAALGVAGLDAGDLSTVGLLSALAGATALTAGAFTGDFATGVLAEAAGLEAGDFA